MNDRESEPSELPAAIRSAIDSGGDPFGADVGLHEGRFEIPKRCMWDHCEAEPTEIFEVQGDTRESDRTFYLCAQHDQAVWAVVRSERHG